LAKITDGKASVGLDSQAKFSGNRGKTACSSGFQASADRVEDPAEQDAGDDVGHGPRHQHDQPEDGEAGQPLAQRQGQREAEDQMAGEARRHERDGVPQRVGQDGVVEQPRVLGQGERPRAGAVAG
jgi:hypothetical protein